jgi:hypothetical protein
MKHAFEIASALFAIGAAVLWLRSAIVRTPKTFSLRVSVSNEDPHLAIGPYRNAYGECPELNDLGEAVIKQSRLSGYAALTAAIAASCQAIAVFLQQA